jgi:hypothetical protein
MVPPARRDQPFEAEGSARRKPHGGRRVLSNGTGGGVLETEPDLRAEKSPEGEKLRSVLGVKQTREALLILPAPPVEGKSGRFADPVHAGLVLRPMPFRR